MPVTTYATVAGSVLMENRAGTVREYLHDPLGSTIALLDSSNTKTHTASYWPYGEVQSGNVSSVTALGFCGAWGYYTETHFMYVRARYYLQDVGRWLTVDPLWPSESAYGYASGSPEFRVDRSGLQSHLACSCTYPGDPGYGNMGQPTPCHDLIPPGIILHPSIVSFIMCLRNNTLEQCLFDHGGQIGNDLWNDMRPYIACVMAANYGANHAIKNPARNPCDPPRPENAQICCYMKYFDCLLGSYDRKAKKWGLELSVCVLNLNHCMAEHAQCPGQIGQEYDGPPRIKLTSQALAGAL